MKAPIFLINPVKSYGHRQQMLILKVTSENNLKWIVPIDFHNIITCCHHVSNRDTVLKVFTLTPAGVQIKRISPKRVF